VLLFKHVKIIFKSEKINSLRITLIVYSDLLRLNFENNLDSTHDCRFKFNFWIICNIDYIVDKNLNCNL